MKSGSIFWGVLLVTLGILFLVNNFGMINMNIGFILDFWPLVLVFWGIALLKTPKPVKATLAGLSGLILALFVFALFTNDWFNCSNHFNIHFSNKWKHEHNFYGDTLKADYDTTYKLATLNFDGGAGKFKFGDTTDKAILIETSHSNNQVSLNTSKNDSTVEYNVTYEGNNISFPNLHSKREAFISLNKNPVWDINIETAASSLDCDFSKYKVGDVAIDAGAAKIMVKFGEIINNADIKFETGVSNIEILLPDSIGCKIETESDISSKDFGNRFHSIGDGDYESDNYAKASKKITISFEGAVSKYVVSYYK